jgi:hypothetical protein
VGTVTDRSGYAARPPASVQVRGPVRDPRRDARVRKAHPLLGAFPLAVMTLASFLVLFTLMMARLTSRANPALGASASSALVASGGGAGAVQTRTSGGGGARAALAPVAASEGSARTSAAIVTSSSGAAGTYARGDD